ncbi:hypothetical protein GCM10023210_30550 [Chryseobacterium ginsengisoli]|uniref:DUF4760 domain-containing protein n=1 Tax=Chryseobacterium ginsengisoli TaxID=363853 RepID=A0ABP9MHA5_9FLAO
MSDNIEYFKASLPIAALVGVVVGAFLNSRLQRKDKIREHLFTYKIKSYMEIARIITETMSGMEKIRNSYYARRDGDNFFLIYDKLKDTISEQSLLISQNTKSDINELFISLQNVYDSEIWKKDYDIRILIYTSALSDCKKFLLKLQNDIGFVN